MTIDRPDYLTSTQAAEQIGKDVSWIAYLCRSGQLPGAFKANPEAKNSPWLIPVSGLEYYKAKKK